MGKGVFTLLDPTFLLNVFLGDFLAVDAVRSVGDLSRDPRERRESSETVLGDLDFLKNDGVFIFVSITIY